jgi:hypothetical protein
MGTRSHRSTGYLFQRELEIEGLLVKRLFSEAKAETVYLKDGTIIVGTIKTFDEEKIVIETSYGTMTFQIIEILRIEGAEEILPKEKYQSKSKEEDKTPSIVFKPRAKKKNPDTALALSILFPGLGQFHNNEAVKGILFVGGGIVNIVFLTPTIGKGILKGVEPVFDIDPHSPDAFFRTMLAIAMLPIIAIVLVAVYLAFPVISGLEARASAERINYESGYSSLIGDPALFNFDRGRLFTAIPNIQITSSESGYAQMNFPALNIHF